MAMNFSLLLILLILLCAIVYIADVSYFAKKRQPNKHRPILVESARTLLPILLVVFVVRAFVVEPFRIPSGSLEPTLLPGDFILVNKFDYGIRLPISNTKLFPIGEPKIGDVVVFHWPVNPSIDYVKRVVGIPGDKISYINKTLYINGKIATQQPIKITTDSDKQKVDERLEDLAGVKHDIYIIPNKPTRSFKNIIVPEGDYFVMGDNRDDSYDSRYWGFVPQKDLIGKAILIWFSWHKDTIRWYRIGERIN